MSNWNKIIFTMVVLMTAMVTHAEEASWDDWKLRTELALDTQAGKKPLYFIETAQPLYRGNDKQNTLLMQFRLAEDDRFTERRNIYNLGLGYRKLLADNAAMAGLKVFYDTEGKYNMSRWSVGADLSWKVFDLYANKYYGLSDWTPTNEGATEKSLNGYDIDLAAQLPYMPWAKAHVMYYQWEKERALENVSGRKVSLEGALSLQWSVEFGRNVDNIVANDNFMLLRYRWAGSVREHQNANNNFWAGSAFEMRDMRDYTLETMRRSNTIAVDRIEP